MAGRAPCSSRQTSRLEEPRRVAERVLDDCQVVCFVGPAVGGRLDACVRRARRRRGREDGLVLRREAGLLPGRRGMLHDDGPRGRRLLRGVGRQVLCGLLLRRRVSGRRLLCRRLLRRRLRHGRLRLQHRVLRSRLLCGRLFRRRRRRREGRLSRRRGPGRVRGRGGGRLPRLRRCGMPGGGLRRRRLLRRRLRRRELRLRCRLLRFRLLREVTCVSP